MCRRDEAVREQNDLEQELKAARADLRVVSGLLRGFICELGGPVCPDVMPATALCDKLGEQINLKALDDRRREERALQEGAWFTDWVHDLSQRVGTVSFRGPRGPESRTFLMDEVKRTVERLLIEHADRGRLLGRPPHA